MVLVHGGPVTGKSTLLHGLAESWSGEVRSASASAEERGLPLGVVGQLLPGWRGADPEDPRVVGEAGEALLDLAAGGPVLVCVDDAQHADRLSLRCLAYVARRVGSRSMRVVLAAGGGDDYYRRFEAQLGRLPHARAVRLSTVDVDEVAGLLGVEGAAGEFHRVSGGNLLLLDALVGDFRETGVVGPGRRFGEAVREYLGRCDPETAAVLKALAVLSASAPAVRDGLTAPAVRDGSAAAVRDGSAAAVRDGSAGLGRDGLARPPAPASIVARGTDSPGLVGAGVVGAVAGVVAVDVVVRGLEESGLLVGGGFRDSAVPGAILAGLSAAERVRVEWAAARELFEAGESASRVAPHVVAAGVRAEPWVVGVLMAASASEVGAGRLERAVEYLEAAGRCAGDAATRHLVTARLAEVEWRFSPLAAHRRLGGLVEAQRAGELPQAVAATLVTLLLRMDRVRQARDALEGLVEDVRRRGPQCPAELSRLRLLLDHLHPALLRAGVRAVLPAEPATVAAAPHLEAFTLLRRVLTDGASDVLVAEVERMLAATAVDESTVDSVVAGVQALVAADRLVEAAAAVDRVSAEPAVRNSQTWRAEFAYLRSVVALHAGDLAACVEHGEAALSHLGEAEWGVRVGGPRAALVSAHTAMGRHDDAAALVDRPVPAELFDTVGGLFHLHARGHHHLATGRLRDARRDFEVSGHLARRLRVDLAPLAPWRTDLAAQHLRHGNPRLARRYAEQQLAKAPRTPSRTRGTALRLLAATAPARERAALLTEAREVLDACGARLELARVLHDLAQAHHAAGRPDRARTVERRAWHLARQCGADPSPPRPALTRRAPDPARVLSDAELRVSALAARGLTNREIAERLYVTVSTVEQHLTKAYRKLKVTGRDALPPRLSPVAEPA
ncbi:LuxR C-terminal-related transcriptional regulator [Saccharothrix sp. NPDC042600]|uniref:LuxR C-terminal-related transcriptional regulator n=1 Tax=Saccharothrix sp. NPDC042600 TaxID=3154492 RepID=UPI0033C47F12